MSAAPGAGSGATKEEDVLNKTDAGSAAQAKQAEEEEFPDPDEDDLDDLDDMLDDFSAVKLDSKKPVETATTAPATSETKAPPPPESNTEDALPEDFAKQLQEGMAELLGELESSPDMQAQFEQMLKGMTGDAGAAAAAPTDGAAPKSSAPPATDADANFSETIRKTMERMQNSGDQATAAAASGSSDDFMSEMLKQMTSGDFNAEGSEEEFSKMLMGMMEQLTNKDVLYEPMKELNDKFPGWMQKNKDLTSAEDLKRYEEQQAIVKEIVGKFEESTYADSNAADREYIVDRMQKMQAAGSPPSDLVGDMDSAQEAFNMPDEQCNPQ